MDGSEDWREHQVLKKVFGQYGNVLDVFLPKSKNMAYIAYEDEEVLERALGLKNMEIQGCRVCLTRADPPLDDRQREGRRAASTGAASGKKPYTESEDDCQTFPRFKDYRQFLHRILVTSMDGSEDWREHQVLKKVFGQYGNVLDVFLPKSKNMAYIAYEDEEVLERALGLKNMEIQGCRVCLTRADPPLDDRQREERRAASIGAALGKKPYTESEDNCQTFPYIVKSTQGKPEDWWLVELVSYLYHSASNPNSFFGQETELGSLANPELGGVPRPHGVDVKVDVINFHFPNTTILVGCKLKCETLISAVSKAAHASSKEREESWFGFNKQRFMVGQHC
jgi:RNA recognition motif-containing protein